MTWTIPNIFYAGTKAKAGEVNENFSSCKSFIDNLETNVATNELDIQALETSKADVNGSYENTFQAADAADDFDVVNKRTMHNMISNSLDTMRGLRLSRFSNNTIQCSSGACYDSTYSYMINSTTYLTKTQSMAANTTYHTYITADKETGTCQLVINTAGGTPELPSGYEYYRYLGYFVTDGSANISTVRNSDSIDTSTVMGFPNYGAGYGVATGVNYTAGENGWVSIVAHVNGNNYPSFYVNGQQVFRVGTWKYADEASAMFPVSKGDVYYLDNSSYVYLVYKFYPMKSIGV